MVRSNGVIIGPQIGSWTCAGRLRRCEDAANPPAPGGRAGMGQSRARRQIGRRQTRSDGRHGRTTHSRPGSRGGDRGEHEGRSQVRSGEDRCKYGMEWSDSGLRLRQSRCWSHARGSSWLLDDQLQWPRRQVNTNYKTRSLHPGRSPLHTEQQQVSDL